jgi:hypothetical protein
VAIANLVFAYAERIDSGDYAGVADLFRLGEITTEGNAARRRGFHQVLQMYEDWTKRHEDGTPRTKHVTTNLIMEVDDELGTAQCRSYFTVLQQTDVLALQPIIAGRYHDHFERVEGTWRFTHRHIVTDLVGDLSQHLLQSIT